MRASGRALHLGRPAVLRHPPAWHGHLASDRARSEAARAGPMLGLPSVSRIVPAATSDRTGPGRPWIPQFPARVIPPAGSAAGGPPPRSAADRPVRETCRSREPAGRFQVTTLQDPTHPQLARLKGGGPTSTAPPRPTTMRAGLGGHMATTPTTGSPPYGRSDRPPRCHSPGIANGLLAWMLSLEGRAVPSRSRFAADAKVDAEPAAPAGGSSSDDAALRPGSPGTVPAGHQAGCPPFRMST
jgi:hypothetical protein